MAAKAASTAFTLSIRSSSSSPFFSSPRTTLSPKQEIGYVKAFFTSTNNNNRCSVSLSSSNDTTQAVVADFKEKPWKERDARLVLEDGSIWKAKSFGAPGTTFSRYVEEVDTSLCRDPEFLEDGNIGELVLMTDPCIENIGINSGSSDDEEVDLKPTNMFGCLIFSSLSTSCTSNWRRLSDYLVQNGIMAIYGVDIDEIISRLRKEELGVLWGVVSTDDSKTDKELLERAHQYDCCGIDMVACLTCDGPFEVYASKSSVERFHVVVVDFGIKHYILRRLAATGCKLTVVTPFCSASEILKMRPDGVLLNNGPGDQIDCRPSVDRVKDIIGKVPVFGICCLSLFGQDYDDEITIGRLAIPTIDTISLLYNHPEGSSLGPHQTNDSDSGFGEFLKAMEQAKAARQTS